MPRHGELTYYQAIGEEGVRHALAKPFSDSGRGLHLMQVGAVLDLLPPVPARVLECGCGTGWLSQIIQKCGYDVVGADVSPHAIELARANPVYNGLTPPEFVVADSEHLPFEGAFDAVVFFDSLHHSIDEQAAVNSAYRALKPGGVLIASETPPGHHAEAQQVAERYDVTEKDMPPRLVVRLGRRAGFRKWRVYPRPDEFGRFMFSCRRAVPTWRSRLMTTRPFNWLMTLALCTVLRRKYGITAMWK
jgi:SAM-dependent methyltransferase